MTSSPDDPVACARAFLEAVLWGAHTTVWDLLSKLGRDAVLAVAVDRGLDRVTASRLRQDQCGPADREAFLRELTHGLRRDFRHVDLTQVAPSTDIRTLDDGSVVVGLAAASEIPGTGAWPVGELTLGRVGDASWRVHRLQTRIVE